MQYSFELAAFLVIRKYQLAHGCTIERPAGIDDIVAECMANLLQRGLSRRHYLARDHVSINNGRAELGEQLRNGRLAARDTAGQADSRWGI
jgi:hypothetical protein